ncbi:MAG: (2Fe-2S) ferredoxin domain-containing protein [Desertifilum sp.]|nr:(2Fe-2S) ferredoxin domain-containing protein [Desertifilum sp.]
MSQFTHTFGSYFLLEGRLAGFELKDNGEPRALRLVTSEGELTIKLKSDLRHQLSTSLVAGDWIQVLGQKKFKPKTGETQLKAKLVKTTAPSRLAAPTTPVAPANPSKACILVCQKSDCCKKGAHQVTQAIESVLAQQGLDDRIQVKKTGCLKNCKAGPNVVVMPDKACYSRIRPQEVPTMVAKHFAPATSDEAVSNPLPAR